MFYSVWTFLFSENYLDLKKSFILSELLVCWAVLSDRKGKCKVAPRVGAMKKAASGGKTPLILNLCITSD
jgi:hypothetical protein